jgi:hypothetical protein
LRYVLWYLDDSVVYMRDLILAYIWLLDLCSYKSGVTLSYSWDLYNSRSPSNPKKLVSQANNHKCKLELWERHRIYFPKFTPKGATSPLRKNSRDGAQELLCSSPKGETNAQTLGSLTMNSSERNEDYKLVVMLTNQSCNHKRRLAV